MVVTCFSAVGQPFKTVGQTISYQQVAVHHHRCGRSGACVSRSSGCCEPVQCALRSRNRALRQVHRLLRFVRRVLERVSYLRERVTRVGEGLRPDRGSMIVGLFRLLRTATRPYAALNPGSRRIRKSANDAKSAARRRQVSPMSPVNGVTYVSGCSSAARGAGLRHERPQDRVDA